MSITVIRKNCNSDAVDWYSKLSKSNKTSLGNIKSELGIEKWIMVINDLYPQGYFASYMIDDSILKLFPLEYEKTYSGIRKIKAKVEKVPRIAYKCVMKKGDHFYSQYGQEWNINDIIKTKGATGFCALPTIELAQKLLDNESSFDIPVWNSIVKVQYEYELHNYSPYPNTVVIGDFKILCEVN